MHIKIVNKLFYDLIVAYRIKCDYFGGGPRTGCAKCKLENPSYICAQGKVQFTRYGYTKPTNLCVKAAIECLHNINNPKSEQQ